VVGDHEVLEEVAPRRDADHGGTHAARADHQDAHANTPREAENVSTGRYYDESLAKQRGTCDRTRHGSESFPQGRSR
jgi:hypothetical protein